MIISILNKKTQPLELANDFTRENIRFLTLLQF